jgi:hypothetical protein
MSDAIAPADAPGVAAAAGFPTSQAERTCLLESLYAVGCVVDLQEDPRAVCQTHGDRCRQVMRDQSGNALFKKFSADMILRQGVQCVKVGAAVDGFVSPAHYFTNAQAVKARGSGIDLRLPAHYGAMSNTEMHLLQDKCNWHVGQPLTVPLPPGDADAKKSGNCVRIPIDQADTQRLIGGNPPFPAGSNIEQLYVPQATGKLMTQLAAGDDAVFVIIPYGTTKFKERVPSGSVAAGRVSPGAGGVEAEYGKLRITTSGRTITITVHGKLKHCRAVVADAMEASRCSGHPKLSPLVPIDNDLHPHCFFSNSLREAIYLARFFESVSNAFVTQAGIDIMDVDLSQLQLELDFPPKCGRKVRHCSDSHVVAEATSEDFPGLHGKLLPFKSSVLTEDNRAKLRQFSEIWKGYGKPPILDVAKRAKKLLRECSTEYRLIGGDGGPTIVHKERRGAITRAGFTVCVIFVYRLYPLGLLTATVARAGPLPRRNPAQQPALQPIIRLRRRRAFT